MMTNHPSNEDLFAYRDGELDLEKRGLVEAHVLSCSACQARIDDTSDAEGMLRQGLQDPSDAYFDRMSESVMGRVTGTAPAGSMAKRSADAAARPERTARPKSFDDGPRNRAPGLPWPAILSAASAAAAVLVVVVMLVQRQDLWTRATVPDVGSKEKAAAPPEVEDQGPRDRDASGGDAPAAGAPEEETTGTGEAPRENAALEGKRAAAKAIIQQSGETKTESATEAAPETAVRKQAAEGSAQQAPSAAGDMRLRVATEAPAPVPAGSAFAGVAARYGLPLLYDPSQVTGATLLRAEPELRVLYQTGGAGEDSARVRLYLAEAARARAAGLFDAETFDSIVHHYRRAVALAHDEETARMARKRLEDFVSRNAPREP